MTETLPQALLAFQAEHVELQKSSINPHFKNRYVSLEQLLPEVVPALNKCGLVVLQMPAHVDGQPALTTTIVHAASGDSVESTMLLLPDKPGPQAQGSALTYARRYALMAFLGLVADEDTDGTPAPSARRSRPANPAAGAGREAPDGGSSPAAGQYATEAQRKRLFALAKENNVETPELKKILERVTGQGSTAQIPRELYDAVCAEVQKDVPFE